MAVTTEENPADSIAHIMKRVVLSLSYHADKRLGAHDLTIAQWTLLMKLRHGRSCTVVDLARGCHLDAGGTTRLIDRLERKNLCKRTRSTPDRRNVQVALTADGEATLAKVRGVPSGVLQAHLSGFSNAEWQALLGYLQRMACAGEAMREQAGSSSGATVPR